MTNTNDLAKAIASGVIDGLKGEDDHFTLIALVIGNLAEYLADTIE